MLNQYFFITLYLRMFYQKHPLFLLIQAKKHGE